MPVSQRYQLDYFAVFTLLTTVLTITFLIVTCFYFGDLANLHIPSTGTSTFLLWTAIILTIIVFGIFIYAMWRLFTHKITIWETEEPIMTDKDWQDEGARLYNAQKAQKARDEWEVAQAQKTLQAHAQARQRIPRQVVN